MNVLTRRWTDIGVEDRRMLISNPSLEHNPLGEIHIPADKIGALSSRS